jgi:hypothetical protein
VYLNQAKPQTHLNLCVLVFHLHHFDIALNDEQSNLMKENEILIIFIIGISLGITCYTNIETGWQIGKLLQGHFSLAIAVVFSTNGSGKTLALDF